MKKWVKIVLIVVAVLVILAGGGLFYLTRGLEAGRNLTIDQVSLDGLADGIYTGQYQAGRWSNMVQVELQNHIITNIKVDDDVTFKLPEVRKALVNRVLEQQSTDVDVISGSTVTSKAYLKAVVNALQS